MDLSTVQRLGLAATQIPSGYRWIWGAAAVGGLWYLTAKYRVQVDKRFWIAAGVGAAGLAGVLYLLRNKPNTALALPQQQQVTNA